MGMVETIIYGLFAFFSVLIAFLVLRDKPLISVLLGIITYPLLILSGYNWRLALIDSGKNPAMLGYARYPFALITLITFAVLALICILVGIILILKRRKQ